MQILVNAIGSLSFEQCEICQTWGHRETECATKKRLDKIASEAGSMTKMAWGTYKSSKKAANVERRMRDTV